MTSLFVTMQVGDAQMMVPAEVPDHLGRHYGDHHIWYENDLLQAIKAENRPGVYIDIGAHYGNHSVFFATQCHASRVIAVEPHPATVGLLRKNVALNDIRDCVHVIPGLIHPSWPTARIDWDEERESWCRSMLPKMEPEGDVACFTLDAVLAEFGCDVLKIDVEELGPEVLRSGLAEIELKLPLIAIEAENLDEQGQVESILQPLGYECLGQFCSTPTFLWRHAA